MKTHGTVSICKHVIWVNLNPLLFWAVVSHIWLKNKHTPISFEMRAVFCIVIAKEKLRTKREIIMMASILRQDHGASQMFYRAKRNRVLLQGGRWSHRKNISQQRGHGHIYPTIACLFSACPSFPFSRTNRSELGLKPVNKKL